MEAEEKLSHHSGKATILVVEDEAIIAKDIARRLEKHGYTVASIASTAGDAIRKAVEERPDLVLMDIVLPGEMDGIDAARLIRSRWDIPVIYLTAYTDEAILERAIRTEPFGYITKPFEDTELCRTIEMGLFKHRMERELRESEEWLSTTLRSIGEAVIATDGGGAVKFMNTVAEELTGWTHDAASGKPVTEVFRILDEKTREESACPVMKALEEGAATVGRCDYILVDADSREKIVSCSGAPIIGMNQETVGAVLVFRDITARKTTERELARSREELQVQAEEIRERNTALKVLLEQRERDRHEFEERVLSNISNLVIPYVEKLKKGTLSNESKTCARILETNLEQITSAFSNRLSSSLVGLTPQELKIASLVKEGRQDKEISDILNISFETVKTHKQHIRKKLGIYGQRKNLRAHLVNFAD